MLSKLKPGLILLLFLQSQWLLSQDKDSLQLVSYDRKESYEIAGIKVSGANYSDEQAIINYSALKIGQQIQIPGPQLSAALQKLWDRRLFDDVQIIKEKTSGKLVFLEIQVQEPPRFAGHFFKGVKKSKHDDLNAIVRQQLMKGAILTPSDKAQVQQNLEEYYIKKGFLDVEIIIEERKDERLPNGLLLTFDIDKNDKVKIENITFTGNEKLSDRKLRKLMSDTNRKRRLFKSSKFVLDDFEKDKKSIIEYYNTLGMCNARILKDSIWRNEASLLMIQLEIEEGPIFYHRNISWKGNSSYKTIDLAEVLGIKKGDIYNTALLHNRLHFDPSGRDISTLYMDNGHLFFKVETIETGIYKDSIDLQISIIEGPKAIIDKVIISGNSTTSEAVIRREIRTKPGQVFSRSDIIRSQRAILNLGYFNPEKMEIRTPLNTAKGTVDIEYVLEEKSSDQLELSAGWGGNGTGIIGTLGVTLNNFSVKRLWEGQWTPLPQGDGQRLSIRAQSSGPKYQSYNLSFTEPWLGGKKPMSLTVAGFYTRHTNGYNVENSNFEGLNIFGGTASLGTRLKWPDDNFIATSSINIQKYKLNNWQNGLFQTDDGLVVSDGSYYNLNLSQTIARVTINDPIFPTKGSKISLSLQFTPPYSWFNNKNTGGTSIQEQFKFMEYHKWKFDAEWYTTLVGKLVLKTKAKFGFLGRYTSDQSISPFERFQLGGDGLSNAQVGYTGVDIISLRAYETTDLENSFINNQSSAAPMYNKVTMELRYPISLNPNATIYALAFAEAGNVWQSYKSYNPFDMKRSAGMGLRVFLPMFGTLGFDYGVGFDKTGAKGLGQYGKFSIILGIEPE